MFPPLLFNVIIGKNVRKYVYDVSTASKLTFSSYFRFYSSVIFKKSLNFLFLNFPLRFVLQ